MGEGWGPLSVPHLELKVLENVRLGGTDMVFGNNLLREPYRSRSGTRSGWPES